MIDTAELLAALHDGRALDLLIGLLVLEMVVMLAWRRLRRRGPQATRLLPTLLAGLCLVLAWRSAQAGAPLVWTAAALLAAGLAHATDMRQRWHAGR